MEAYNEVQLSLDLFCQNRFNDAKKVVQDKADYSAGHAIGLCHFMMPMAIFTGEKVRFCLIEFKSSLNDVFLSQSWKKLNNIVEKR